MADKKPSKFHRVRDGSIEAASGQKKTGSTVFILPYLIDNAIAIRYFEDYRRCKLETIKASRHTFQDHPNSGRSAAWLAYLTGGQVVGGSNPLVPTI